MKPTTTDGGREIGKAMEDQNLYDVERAMWRGRDAWRVWGELGDRRKRGWVIHYKILYLNY